MILIDRSMRPSRSPSTPICSLSRSTSPHVASNGFLFFRRRQSSPEQQHNHALRRESASKPEPLTNGTSTGPSHDSYESLSPKSKDSEDSDEEHASDTLDRGYIQLLHLLTFIRSSIH